MSFTGNLDTRRAHRPRTHTDISTLCTRGPDWLDFHDASIWVSLGMMQSVYDAGSEYPPCLNPATPYSPITGLWRNRTAVSPLLNLLCCCV
jgi:hypothetical protein